MSVGKRRASHLGPERRRPQVLDAARVIALAKGVPAVTFHAIAEHLGVTRPVVYSCFADRRELFQALLQREEAQLLGGVLKAFPATGAYQSTEAAYIGGMQALLGFVAEHPDTWRVLFYSNPGPDVAELFAQGRRRAAQEFARLVQPDLTRWHIADVERMTPVLVDVFVSIAESGVRTLLSDENRYSPEQLGVIIGHAGYAAMRSAVTQAKVGDL